MFWIEQLLCVCRTSYSTSEAPRPNYPHSRCLHHISSEAGHIRGSCTQRETGGSTCRWESGLLKVRISLLNFVAIFKPICTANELQELRKTNQSGILTARCLISVVQTVWVAVAFEALRDAVPTAALEVTRMTSPQLCSNRQTEDKAHRVIIHSQRGSFVMTSPKKHLAN